MSFEKAQGFVKLKEGGYTDHPKDNGNWTGGKANSGVLIGTNHGISAPVLNAYYKKNFDRSATKQDMINLPYATALQIYKSQYWDRYNLDRINSFDVQLVVYDGLVNQGAGTMQRVIKKALAAAGKDISESDTFKTTGIDTLNSVAPKVAFENIKAAREEHYRSLSTFSTFGKGWMNRLKSLVYTATDKAESAIATGNVSLGKNIVNVWPVFALGLGLSIAGLVFIAKA